MKEVGTVIAAATAIPERDRFRFYIDELIEFIFPPNLQHPLAAARLIAFGLYGPLDNEGHLRSGRKGDHVLAEYELETMCIQIEREDIIQIYLHRARDMGLLSSGDQDMIINLADAHLKKEKGKAMLPRINKQNVRDLLKVLPVDAFGRISFHEAQKVLEKYRLDRVKRYKLVFPDITTTSTSEDTQHCPQSDSRKVTNASMSMNKKQTLKTGLQSTMGRTVSTSVAPETMFQRMKGLSNADLMEQATERLGRHGFKIVGIEKPCSVAVASNVKLLRDIPPHFPNPYAGRREEWDGTSNMGKVGVGSLVQGTSSSTSWRRKYTSY